jgi:hypothetical protein
MLQVLYLDVSKVDRVLHILQCDPPATVAGGGVAVGVGGADAACGRAVQGAKARGASTAVH